MPKFLSELSRRLQIDSGAKHAEIDIRIGANVRIFVARNDPLDDPPNELVACVGAAGDPSIGGAWLVSDLESDPVVFRQFLDAIFDLAEY